MNFISDDNYCVMCGKLNPVGLRLEFRLNNGESEADVIFPKYFEGYNGITHGGIVSSVLDEASVYAATSIGEVCVTGELKVRFKRPVKTNAPYVIKGKIIERRGKIILTKSKIVDNDGNIYAYANAKLFSVKEDS